MKSSTTKRNFIISQMIQPLVGFHMTRFYFHDALEQLKTNFHTIFFFKRVIGFVIEDV